MRKIYLLLIFLSVATIAMGQIRVGSLTLDEAIRIAHSKSPQSQMAQLSYMAQYWNFRSYKAQLLPSILIRMTADSNIEVNSVAVNSLP